MAIQLFTTPLQNQFADWAFEYVAEGADVGEIEAIANDMKGSDDGAYYDAWYAHALNHQTAASDAEARGKTHTARYHYLRTAVYASVSYKLLFGKPVDARLMTAFNTQTGAFMRAMALSDPPAEAVVASLGNRSLDGFFLRAAGAAANDRRPTIILVNGYDASVSDMYLAMGHQAVTRGYNVVMIDGPGQGVVLIVDGVALIPMWEDVVNAVVDAILKRPDVDPKRIVLQGWSLGGHLALRGATGEPRLAACIADPPAWSILQSIRPAASQLGLSPEAAARLPEISDADLAVMTAKINADQRLHWTFLQRGLWVNSANDLRDWLQIVNTFTLDGRGDRIQCPVLGTKAESDPLAAGAEETLARLQAPTTLLKFSAADGAGGHQETLNRALAETCILDWLDDTLA